MTTAFAPADLADLLRRQFPDIEAEAGPGWVRVASGDLLRVFRFMRDDPDLDFVFLCSLTAVDRLDELEVVYHLQSLRLNHLAVIKVMTGRENPSLPSVSGVWYGAHLQEAEAYDLMGIRFEGHPNLRRIFLWEGFSGWPLRKDFRQLGEGAYNPGLPHFPKEGGARGVLAGPNWTLPAPGSTRAETDEK
ncbi:MAG TPA: NADH-quinone oxidoreductase subunit C [Dehalococcoidia bacterium]|nr:NADH-quinone oxidoreductase subunit C [Dehalococcoidia bacterium]